MASSMPCWKSPPPAEHARWCWPARSGWPTLLLACAILLASWTARADAVTSSDELAQISATHDADGLHLSARLNLRLSPNLEDALYKGIPLHFVWRADVVRQRWYWTDKKLASATRTVRLAYQPLTRRWRLSTITGEPDSASLQQALHQNLDTLTEALGSVGRVLRWKIADAEVLDTDASRIDFRFQLDHSLLPRPFQIGVANQGDWSITLQRSLPLPAPSAPGNSGARSAAGD
jgi:hypothetical protein